MILGPRAKNVIDTLYQFVRFNVVGLVNTAVTFGVYALLVALGLHHLAALVAIYALGIVLGFTLNKRITFGVRERTTVAMAIRMVLGYLPILALNAVFLDLLVTRLGVGKYASQAISLVFVAVSSYLTQRFFVFRKKRPPRSP